MNGMVTNFTSSVEIRNSQIAHSQNVVVEVRLFVLLMVDFASSAAPITLLGTLLANLTQRPAFTSFQ